MARKKASKTKKHPSGYSAASLRHKKQSNIEVCLELESLCHLSAKEELETRKTIDDFVSRSVEDGLIPVAMLPLVEDLLNARLSEMHAYTPTSPSILPRDIRDFDATVGITGSNLLIPPLADVALYSLATNAYLLGGPGNIVFQVGDEADGYSFSDFVNSEWFLPVLEEVLIELVLLGLHLMPGGHGAGKVAEKVAKKAAKNARIRRIVKDLIEDLANYGTRGRGAEKLRKNLKALFVALTGMELFADAMKEFFKSLSAWGIFLIFLDLLLAFTPVGWGKRVGVILLSVGALTHALHTKYELWKKGQAQQGGG